MFGYERYMQDCLVSRRLLAKTHNLYLQCSETDGGILVAKALCFKVRGGCRLDVFRSIPTRYMYIIFLYLICENS